MLKNLKKVITASMIALTVSIPAFAFDMAEDMKSWSENPDCMVTMYTHMNYADFSSNFSNIPGWTYSHATNPLFDIPSDEYGYTRIQPSSFSTKVREREKIGASFENIHDFLFCADIQFDYICDFKTNLNFKKDHFPAFKRTQEMTELLLQHMKNKYGEPDKGPYSEYSGKQGTMKDGVLVNDHKRYIWIRGEDVYILDSRTSIKPMYSSAGYITGMNIPYIASVKLSHTYNFRNVKQIN